MAEMDDTSGAKTETPLRRPSIFRRLFNPAKQTPGPTDAYRPTVYEGDYEIFRNACPRNCYDTCSIKTYVKDGVIQFIEGAPESTFTDGGLCVKGYAYVRSVYSPDRIKYPMLQMGRESGKWQRISWDEAMDRIARKILEIKHRDGSLLGLCLAQESGHMGITNTSAQGMMSSLGFTTRCAGTPCWPAGIDAQTYDMGAMWCNDPEDMVHSRYIILWGVNPAWCSIHTMKYIYAAREKGATVLTIDPVFTQTAAKSDLYWSIRPGTDGALALGMARYILEMGEVDETFVRDHAVGYQAFEQYLKEKVTLAWAADQCGIPKEEIAGAAEAFAAAKPATIWIGYGLQRHTNGGANVRAIDALGAISGNIGRLGGGVRYGHLSNRIFNYNPRNFQPPEGSKGLSARSCRSRSCWGAGTGQDEDQDRSSNRIINTNKLAHEMLNAADPPIRMMWVACRNPLSQDFNRPLLEKAFRGLEMVVAAEQFFTHTTQFADIVLPVPSLFEQWSVNVSYWHYWLSINQPAIAPLYECKSDTEIAALLSAKMNELEPGSCSFPTQVDMRRWVADEFNDRVKAMFGLETWEELLAGPRKAKMPQPAWPDLKFRTPSGKYEFVSDLAAAHGHGALPVHKPGRTAPAPFRVLSPHAKFSIHSQFQNLDTMAAFNPEPYVCIHPQAAAAKGIADGDRVRIWNQVGEVILKARVTDNVRKDLLLVYEAWFNGHDFCVQNLVDDTSADMGAYQTGSPGVAIHAQFADIEQADGHAKR